MAERLSISVTFQSLVARVAAIEAGGGIGGGPYLPLAGGTLTGALTTPQCYAKSGVNGYASLTHSGSPDYTGYMELIAPGGTRQGYIGFCHLTNDAIRYVSESGGGHSFTGGAVSITGNLGVSGTITAGDANYQMLIEASNPTLRFDTGDGIVYNRAANIHLFYIANNVIASLSASAMSVGVNLDVAGTLTQASAPVATQTYVNAQIAALVNSAPGTLDTLNELATALGDDPNFATSTATLIGTKAALGGALFTGTVNVGDARFGLRNNTVDGIIDFDTNDYLYYSRSDNSYIFNIGGLTALSLTSNNMALGSTVQLTVGDGNNFLSLNGGNPVVNFDTGDCAIHYTRGGSSGFYTFTIAADTRLSITNAYTFAATAMFAGDTNFGLYGATLATPTLQFDTGGDGISYTRSTNTFSFNIGGAAKATLSASAFVVTPAATLGATTVDSASGLLVVNGGSGHGQVALSPGATTGTGSVVLLDPTGSQHSAIGPCTTAGPMGFISNNAAGFYFSGGVMQIISGLHLYLGSIPTYANNAAAITGGLAAGDVYMTSTGQLMVRF